MSFVREANPSERVDILALEASRQRALIDVDLDTLADLFDDALVHVHAAGPVHTKEMLLEHTNTRRPYLEITRGDLRIRMLSDDVAVMTGELTNRMRAPGGGERTLSGPVTQIVAKKDPGNWRFVSFQMTPYGDAVWGQLPSEMKAEEEA